MNINKNVRFFNGYCYVCNGYEHKDVECKVNKNFIRDENGSMMQHGSVCYNYNNVGHVAKFGKNSNEKNTGLESIVDSRGKGKLLWVKKSDEKIEEMLNMV